MSEGDAQKLSSQDKDKEYFNAIFFKIKINARKIHDEQNVEILNKKTKVSC